MWQRLERTFLANTFTHRVLHKAAFGLAMLFCIAWAFGASFALRSAHDEIASNAAGNPVELPTEWDGAKLRPLALSAVEQRFADGFPGTIARLTDGHRMLVLRHVNAPTRMLHPATDCYRALGWGIEQAQLEHDAEQRLWRCFTALKDGHALRVCERIVDAQGRAFSDNSAWYWAAASGQSQGPWQAITLATPLASPAPVLARTGLL